MIIQNYICDLATQTGIPSLQITVVEGRYAGCLDVQLLHLTAEGQLVDILVHQSELDDLHNSMASERLDVKIRAALLRLKSLIAT